MERDQETEKQSHLVKLLSDMNLPFQLFLCLKIFKLKLRKKENHKLNHEDQRKNLRCYHNK